MSCWRDAWIAHNQSDQFIHDKCARAKIFARDHNKVVDMQSMRRIMRYNDFEHDPISQGNPAWAISSRHDLSKSNPGAFGATDCKITSWTQMQLPNINYDAVSGPTHDQQPVFVWSKSVPAIWMTPHHGQPDSWPFDWQSNVVDDNTE